MMQAADRLEVLRREEWRKLNGDVERLARDAGDATRLFVSRHPIAALASFAAAGMFVTTTVRTRPKPVDTGPGRKRRLAATLGSLLRTSLNGGLAAVLQDKMRPQERDASDTGPSMD